jgi:hypothetical protein
MDEYYLKTISDKLDEVIERLVRIEAALPDREPKTKHVDGLAEMEKRVNEALREAKGKK